MTRRTVIRNAKEFLEHCGIYLPYGAKGDQVKWWLRIESKPLETGHACYEARAKHARKLLRMLKGAK